MKNKCALLAAITLFFLFPLIAHASVQVKLLDKSFVRGAGTPVTVMSSFMAVAGQVTIKLTNGSAEDSTIEKVSSSTISLNGQIVFDASNFNQNVATLEKTANLNEGTNEISVLLKSKPGGQIRIQIVQEIDAAAAKLVGPEGGIIEVTERSSYIYGAKIEIPPGALTEGKIVSIKRTSLSSTLPEGATNAGPFVSFEPSGTQFALPVHVTIPYDDKDNDGLIDYSDVPETEVGVFYHSDGTSIWEEVPIYSQDKANKRVSINVTHFSAATAKISSSCTDPVFVLAIDGMKLGTLLGLGGYQWEPSYLQQAILNMGLFKNRSCVVAYSGSKRFDLRWDGDAYKTEDFIQDVIDTVKSYSDEATRLKKKFVLVNHSWGTILGLLGLMYNKDVNPDLLVSLSSPRFTENAGDGVYEHLVKTFTDEQIQDTKETLGRDPDRDFNSFSFPWKVFWAHGDVISGPRYANPEDSINSGRVDYGLITDRDAGSTKVWHAITTMDKNSMEGVIGRALTPFESLRADELISTVKEEIGALFKADEAGRPSTPGQPTAATASSTQIDLTWTASIDDIGVTGYTVCRNGSNCRDVPENKISISGLSPDTSYFFCVTAFDAADNKSFSACSWQRTSVLDTTSPSLASSTPSDKQPDVPVSTRTVSFTFSEPMKPEGTVIWTGIGFAATSAWNPTNTTITFTFPSDLPQGTTIGWTLNGFFDLFANPLDAQSAISGSFTTASSQPTSALIAFYPFNGNANDASGNGHNGTVRGGSTLTIDRFSTPGSAYSFNSLDDYIDLGPESSLFPNANFSVAVWVKVPPLGSSGFGIIGNYNQFTVPFWYILMTGNSYPDTSVGGGKAYFGLRSGTIDGASEQTLFNSKRLDDNQWHFLVAVRDAEAGKMYLYVDGVLDASRDGTRDSVWSGQNIVVARASSFVPNFTGDDVRIYSGLLSAAEIQALYQEQPNQNPATGTFTKTGDMITARHQHTATLLESGKVLIAGGLDHLQNFFNSAELYDPSTGTFSTTGSMGWTPAGHKAVRLSDGRVLIAGGHTYASPSAYVSTAQLYNPTSGTFTDTGSLNTARGYYAAALLSNGKVLIAGGLNGSGGLSSAELFDPATGRFTNIGNMNYVRGWCPTLTTLSNGTVLITGGGDSPVAEIYDPDRQTFTTVGSMTTTRLTHSAILLSDGKVLVTGGTTFDSIRIDTAELYDPSTGTFTATGNMTNKRAYTSDSSLLQNGKVLVVGGTGGAFDTIVDGLNTAELYDPSTGTFTATENMTDGRRSNASTVLTNGTVLITGGYNSLTASTLKSAEIYSIQP